MAAAPFAALATFFHPQPCILFSLSHPRPPMPCLATLRCSFAPPTPPCPFTFVGSRVGALATRPSCSPPPPPLLRLPSACSRANNECIAMGPTQPPPHTPPPLPHTPRTDMPPPLPPTHPTYQNPTPALSASPLGGCVPCCSPFMYHTPLQLAHARRENGSRARDGGRGWCMEGGGATHGYVRTSKGICALPVWACTRG